MTDDRLSDALHELTPEPPRTLTGSDVRAAAGSGRRRWFPAVRSRRLELGLVVVAMVAVVGVVLALVTWPGRTTSAPPATAPAANALDAPCSSAEPGPTPSRSGTPPATMPASAFGPQARQDGGGRSGSADYLVFPQQPASWQVMENGSSYADSSTALSLAATYVNRLRCTAAITEVHPAGAQSLADTVFFHDPPEGGYADGNWRIISVTGTHVLVLSAQAVNDPPVGGPGDAFLVSLAAAARDAAEGKTPTPVTLPRGSSASPAPTGFLALDDLGTGWTIGTDASDRGTVAKPYVPGKGCDTVYLTAADGSAPFLVYRGTQPEGDGEWLLTESITTLTTEGVAKARAALEAATTCAKVDVLASGTGIAGDYLLAIRYKTEVGEATAYILSGTTLISLETLPGGAIGGVALPGGTDWLTGVSAKAVARLAG